MKIKKSKPKRKVEVGEFVFEVSGGRFSVASLKECLHFYTDYLGFCEKSTIYPITPVNFVFVIAASQRKSEYGKRRIVRQLTEKMGLFPFLFWVELRSHAWKSTNKALVEASEKERKSKYPMYPFNWKM